MYFVIFAEDKPNILETRMANREAHLEYVRGSGKMELGYATKNEAGEMDGSVLIIEVENRKAAEDFVANDPYVKAGVFSNVTIKELNR